MTAAADVALPPVEAPDHSPMAAGYGFVAGPRVGDGGAVSFSDLVAGGYQRVRPGAAAEALPAFPHLASPAFGEPELDTLYAPIGGLIAIRADTPGTRDFKARITA